jgi:hypothetical protein
MFRWLAVILIMLGAVACAMFGIVYFAGLKSDVADKYGATGKAFSIVVTILTVPLFNLGRFIAKRNRPPPKN